MALLVCEPVFVWRLLSIASSPARRWATPTPPLGGWDATPADPRLRTAHPFLTESVAYPEGFDFHWTKFPLSEFWPREDCPAPPGADLVRIAVVHGPEAGFLFGDVWSVTSGGILRAEYRDSCDAWSCQAPVPAEALARLPALLEALPPSDPAPPPANRVYVAFPVKGLWVVRKYRRDPLPRQVADLAHAVKAF